MSAAEVQRFQQKLADKEYFIAASLGLIPGVSTEVKFGHSAATTAVESDVWPRADVQPTYIFPVDTGELMELVGTDAGDTQEITIKALDPDGVEIFIKKNLNGLTPVPLGQLIRATNRIHNSDATPMNGSAIVQGDGSTSTNIFAIAQPGEVGRLRTQQTSQAIYVNRADKVAVVVNMSTAVNKTGVPGESCIFSGQSRKTGGVFRTQIRYGIQNNGTSNISSDLVMPPILPPLAQMAIAGNPSTAGLDISAEFSMLLFDKELVPPEILASLEAL